MRSLKKRTLIGIVLILLGIALAATGIGMHVAHMQEPYQAYIAKYDLEESFWNYYSQRSTGNTLVSVASGLIPVGFGIYLVFVRPWWYDPEIH